MSNIKGSKEQYYRPVCVSSCFFSFSVVPNPLQFLLKIFNLLVYIIVTVSAKHTTCHTFLIPRYWYRRVVQRSAHLVVLSDSCYPIPFLSYARPYVGTAYMLQGGSRRFSWIRRYTQCKPYTMSGHAITSFLQVLHGSCFLTRRRISQ